MFNCRRLAPSQFPNADVSFHKKLVPSLDSKATEYLRKASTEPASDPRTKANLPRTSRITFKPVFPSTRSWCAAEPSNILLLEGIPSAVKSEASLLAQLEELLQDSGLQIRTIELAPETAAASLVFFSGFAAWETMRRLMRVKHGFKRIVCDPEGKLFQRQKSVRDSDNRYNRHSTEPDRNEIRINRHSNEHERNEIRSNRHSNEHETNDNRYNRHSNEQERFESRNNRHSNERYSSNTNDTSKRVKIDSLSCNPFVPCLKIPFEDYDRLGFSHRIRPIQVISSLFDGKIGSFVGVEEASSSWHVHFGREIDVIEADQMLMSETFHFDGRSFYFHRWKLVKDGKPWKVPTKEAERVDVSAKPSAQNEMPKIKDLVEEAADMKGLLSSLPQFVKKRESEVKEGEAKPVLSSTIDQTEQVRDAAIQIDEVANDQLRIDEPWQVVHSPLNTTAPERSSLSPVKKKRAGRKKKEAEADSRLDVGEDEPIFEETLSSGCARSEGFFLLPRIIKERVKFRGILEAFSTESSSTSSADTNRSSRIQNRRPLLGTGAALDLFRVSPLQSAQKRVALRNSSIHSYGLVILEPADPGDLIIEYVGELVRASVANVREWHYEREYRGDGIASSYLFRLDDVMVIDATKKGSLARFINHSCDPNCVAKTISLNGSKRIVMYAKKPLRPGDELTYDYKFPLEKNPEKRVKCLCGSSICRKFLN